MSLSFEQIQQISALGIEENIVRQVDISDDQFDHLMHGLKILLLPKSGKGPFEPVRYWSVWQLELLVGKLDHLPKQASIMIKKSRQKIENNCVVLQPKKNRDGSNILNQDGECILEEVWEDYYEPEPKLISEWKDSRGLNIAHYAALSGKRTAFETLIKLYPQIVEHGINNDDISTSIHHDRQLKNVAHYAGLAFLSEVMQYLLETPKLLRKLWTKDLMGGTSLPSKISETPNRTELDIALNDALQRVRAFTQTEKDIELLSLFSKDIEMGNDKTIAHVAAEIGNIAFLQALKEKNIAVL